MALKDQFLTQISQKSKNIEHFAEYCRFFQFVNITIVLICVNTPEKELLFQWTLSQARAFLCPRFFVPLDQVF